MKPTRRRLLIAGVGTASLAGVGGCLDAVGGDTDGLDADSPDTRVDDPPYPIEAPDPGTGDGDWDEAYLCAGLAAEPSVAFTQAVSSALAVEGGLDYDTHESDEEYLVELLSTADGFDRLSGDLRDELGTPDFETEAVLLVQTAWGSSSVRPHLVRIEPTDGGVHAYGCHVEPFVRTDDITVRTLAARFERPEAGLDQATLSLTVDTDRRVHVVAGEGVVSV